MKIRKIRESLSERAGRAATAATAALLAGMLMVAATGCGSTTASTDTEIDVTSTEYYEQLMGGYQVSDLFTDRDLEGSYDESEAVNVTLSDSGSSASGSGVEIDGSTVMITAAGTYVLSGSLSDGQVVVKAGDSDKVQIVLNGVSLGNSAANVIYAQSADKVFVTAAEGTENTLKTTGDAATSDTDKNLDGVIFAECDMTINGTGTINVESAKASGVVGKDDLKLAGVTLNVTAAENGIEANDSVRVASGTCTIVATEDGIHSDNDEEPQNGYFYMFDGTVTISAGDDAVHASSYLTVNGGTLTVNESGEGLEGAVVTINDGTVDVTSKDDGINASSGGGGDMFMGLGKGGPGGMGGQRPADGQMPADGELPEGMEPPADGEMPADAEGSTGGEMTADAEGSTDGEMTAPPSGAAGTGASEKVASGTADAEGSSAATDESAASLTPLLTINGGTINVSSYGDGIDSNGNLIINGGETYVSGPINNGNTAVDYGDGCTAVQNGGILIAAGSSGMAESFDSSSTQGVILATLDEYTEGEITLKDSSGNVIASFTPEKKYNCVIVSTPEVKSGSDYTLTTGGGTAEKSITMDSNIYSEASGFGAIGGGMGGGRGGRMNRQDAAGITETADAAN
ncbi:MAG: carbohydrate-binding domain-containing protein [Clostridia bacterium]|nr:carbohydrate-binding domain-containing protein [Clostridia bacterium]